MRVLGLLAAASLALVSVNILPAAAVPTAGGVVPGLTGAAARQAAGEAGVRFRELTESRLQQRADLHTAWGTFFRDTASTGLRATHTVLGVTTNGNDSLEGPAPPAPRRAPA